MKNNKKIKYGSLSVTLTAVFVAVIVLLNAVISVINKNGDLNIDTTSDSLYTVSNASVKLLQSNEVPVKIYFLQDRDDVLEDENSEGFMLNLVDSYLSNFSFIEIEFIDLDKNPKFKDRYTNSSTEKLSKTSIIVECPETKEYKVLTAADYFLLETKNEYYYSYQVATGFQGELALTSAILNVITPDELSAAFVTGHGEIISEPLKKFLESVGYKVENLQLSDNEIEDKFSLLVVNDPKYDFGGNINNENAKSEIEKLVEYMDKPNKNMLVFMHPDSPKLNEFEEFLAVYGIAINRNVIVDNDNSVSLSDGKKIYGIYTPSGENVFADDIINRLNPEYKTVFYKAAPIKILFKDKNNIGVTPLVTTSKTAVCTDDDNNVQDEFNMLTLSYKAFNDGFSKLAVCSTLYYNNELERTTYANRDLFYSLMQSFGAVNISPDIPIKTFDNTTFDISENASRTWGILITFVPAAIVLIVGTITWLKRRHL